MNATIDTVRAIDTSALTEKKPAWAGVFSMAMGIVGLIMAELLPVSLLTPMATDLHISEGAAGQAITATAIVALVSSLFTAIVTRRIDRRIVILSFSFILIASNLLVAFAPNYFILLAGRVLLGIAVGGFWAMAAAIAMQLVPQSALPKAFAIIFGAGTIATAIAAPIGTYLGSIAGWRGAFFVSAVFGVVALIWQAVAMPSVPPTGQTRLKTLVDVLKRPQVGLGMLAVLLVFAGHFSFFTYLRPFLETETGVGVSVISAILLAFGIANFIGNSAAGPLLNKNLRLVLLSAPLLLVLLGIGLLFVGSNLWATAILITLWGLGFGKVPVAWSTWISRTIPDEPESGGALLVASIQLAITIGAAIGGLLFDKFKVQGSFTGSIILLFIAALIILIGRTASSKKVRKYKPNYIREGRSLKCSAKSNS